MLDRWSKCVWAACESMCEAWSVMRHEAGELSGDGTAQGTVTPSNKFPFLSSGQLRKSLKVGLIQFPVLPSWTTGLLHQHGNGKRFASGLHASPCPPVTPSLSWVPAACFALFHAHPRRVLSAALCMHSVTEQYFSTKTSPVELSRWLCFLSV